MLRPTTHTRWSCVLILAVGLAAGCGGKKADKGAAPAQSATPQAPERVHGMTKEEAAKVLIKVGDREITAGDFQLPVLSL